MDNSPVALTDVLGLKAGDKTGYNHTGQTKTLSDFVGPASSYQLNITHKAATDASSGNGQEPARSDNTRVGNTQYENLNLNSTTPDQEKDSDALDEAIDMVVGFFTAIGETLDDLTEHIEGDTKNDCKWKIA